MRLNKFAKTFLLKFLLLVSIILTGCSKGGNTNQIFESKSIIKMESNLAFTSSEDEVFLNDLVPYIRTEIERGDWYGAGFGPIFHSNIDWHSSVHAHWAILRINRVTGGHLEDAQWINSRFSPEFLQQELEFIDSFSSTRPFEMPYGRAWYLQLAREFYNWAEENDVADKERFFATSDVVAESMLAFYADQIADPNVREYSNPSWPFIQLFLYYQLREDAENLKVVNNLINQMMTNFEIYSDFDIDRSLPFDQFSYTYGYFSTFGNLVFLLAQAQTEDEFKLFLDKHALSSESIAPLDLTPPDEMLHGSPTWNSYYTSIWARKVGHNASRGWAMRALENKATTPVDQQRFYSAWRGHVDQNIFAHGFTGKIYSEISYSHWVPQFTVFAMTSDIEMEIKDLDPPVIYITNPKMDEIVTGDVQINVEVNDNVAVTSVQFFVNDNLICTDSLADYSCTWSMPNAAGKLYEIRATAKDAAGNQSSDVIQISSKNKSKGGDKPCKGKKCR